MAPADWADEFREAWGQLSLALLQMHAVELIFRRPGYRVRVFPDVRGRVWRRGVTLLPREGNLVRGKSVKDMARRYLGFVNVVSGAYESRRFASGG